MPYRNRIKELKSGTMFHVYARGINRNDIFSEPDDYIFFTYLFKKYLTKDFKEEKLFKGEKIDFPVNSSYNEVELYAYCLMKNHFHFLAKNLIDMGIANLARKVLSNYSSFFNSKYNLSGAILQGGYRAVPIHSEYQLIHVGRYIHLNPLKSGIVSKTEDYEYSSYRNYVKEKEFSWLKIQPAILTSTKWDDIDSYAKDIEEDSKSGIIFD